jgi:hypothetical protein
MLRRVRDAGLALFGMTMLVRTVRLHRGRGRL